MALFESYERREKQILAVIKEYGINSVEECAEVCKSKGLDIYKLVEGIQPICFENAKWAYTVGCAIAIKKGCTRAADAAAAIGEGLQAFCIPGSVADQRKVGLGHGNLGKMMDFIKKGDDANTALEKAKGQYGRVADAVKFIDPRKQ